MKQTAVEWLIEEIKSKADKLPTNTKENRMAKGIYVDCLLMARQAKEMESQQQGYSEEEVIKFAKYCAELKVYDNKTYVNNTFEMLLQQFKNK